MNSPTTLFTAAEIGRCLACTSQNVRNALRAVPPGGKKIVSGVETVAWQLDKLPNSLVAKLGTKATFHGFPTPLLYLQNAPRANRDRVSSAHVADEEITRAQKLKIAFTRCLTQPERPVAELARIASEDYRREFGHSVSDRHLRELIDRTIKRDQGHRNFARIDLYFSERPAKRLVQPSRLTNSFRFDELDAHFATLRDRTRPALAEIAHSWREVIRLIADRLTIGADEIKLKRELRAYLVMAAPFLGDSEAVIKRTLNRKLREAVEKGFDQITDRRLLSKKTGRGRPSDFDAMIKLLAQHTVFFCGKRESQSYRQLYMGTTHNGDRFSEEFRLAYPFDCRRAKSRIPTCVRRAVTPMVAAMWAERLGPRARRLTMPSIHRDWSEVLAGDSYTSDDVTLNHPIVDWHERGEYEFNGRRFNVVRPQFLPVVDERTGNPLGFSLAPAPNYNSWQIRTLIARICMRPEIGLPFKRFAFEKGLWSSRNVAALSSWSEVDESFVRRGISLSVRHATTPKAKIIEQVIGALQNLDEYAPGYVGRSEQTVKHEREQRFLQKLKRVGQPQKAEVDPTEMFMTTERCAEMLIDVMRRFADEPQNGERLAGLSPAEGWEQLCRGRAHHVLPNELRFLLATAESVQTVTNEGIVLRIGTRKNYYSGAAQLGALIGEKVRVRYNPELPEQITVSHLASDPKGQQPFSVPLFDRVRAHDATSDEFARARFSQKQFVEYGRALYRELAPKANLTITRADLGSPELRSAGAAHNRLERECIDLTSERESARDEIEQLASRHNLAIDPKKVRRPKRVVSHLRKVADLKAKILAKEAAAASHGEVT
jgi:hypothetical protein